MNVLAFDTCFEACSAAVQVDAVGGAIRTAARFERMAQGHAERLVPMIAEVMAEAGVTFGDLDRIGVTTGPGSFTGTRICVAAARAFALAYSVPLVGLSSLAVMAVQVAEEAARLEGGSRPILVAMDVRRGEAYCQLFAPSGCAALTEPSLMSIAQSAELACTERAFVAGSSALEIAQSPEAKGFVAAGFPGLLPDARAAVILAQSSFATTASVAPLYLRPPDAKPPTKVTVTLLGSREDP